MSKSAATRRPQCMAESLLLANFRADRAQLADRVFPEEGADILHLRSSRDQSPILRVSRSLRELLQGFQNRAVPGWSQERDRLFRAPGGKQQKFARENRIASLIYWLSAALSLESY